MSESNRFVRFDGLIRRVVTFLDMLSHGLQMFESCSRQPGHSGPCNGLPRPECLTK